MNIAQNIGQAYNTPAEFITYLNTTFKAQYSLKSTFWASAGNVFYGNFERFETAGIVMFEKLILDLYPGAVVGWSLRRISGAYNGPLIRVRNGNTNAEQDIAFNSQYDLDTTSLQAFLNGATGYVVKFYDQSGNGNHITQTLAASQPQIILNQIGGKPAVVSDGTTDYMRVVLSADAAQPYTHAMVANINGGTGERTALHQYSSTNASTTIFRVSGGSSVVSHGYQYTFTWNLNTNELFILNRNNPLATGSLWRNGVSIAPTILAANSLNIRAITLFAQSNSTGTTFANYGACKLSEYVLWGSGAGDLTASKDALQAEINGYYHIF